MDLQAYPIPPVDREVFDTMPEDVRKDIHCMLRIFWAVDHAPHGHRGAAWRMAIGAENAIRRMAGQAELVKSTLYNKRKAFHDAKQDWSALIDTRRVTDWDAEMRSRTGMSRGLPPAFREHLFGLALKYGRSSNQAIEELYRSWQACEAIPGYGRWTDWWDERYEGKPYPSHAPLPHGWGKRNLHRYLEDRAALEIGRRGVASALPMLPGVIRTRAGLRPMEWVVLDDWRADFLVYVPGFQEPVELNGILAMDVATATTLRFGLRPSLPKADGSHEGLKRIDAKCIVAELLLKWGYPRDYVCNIIVERGTATITPADAAAITQATNGQVRIHWTSMISGNVFGWQDKPVGNFRGKAWLESFFNLLHNACAAIPGQIGAHYQQRPARVAAQQAECTALLKAQSALPRELRDTINYRLPFLDVDQARTALNFVFHYLNNRENHALEGFERILKFRLEETDPWRPVQILIDKGWTREMILGAHPRPHMETPIERWHRLCDGIRFQRFSRSSAPLLLTDHRKITIERDGEVNIGSASKPKLYRDRENPRLKTGAKFLAFLSTQDDRWIHLTDERKAYVASVPRADRIQHGDPEAAALEIAAKTRQLKAKVAEVNRLNPNAANRLADIEHNNRMLDEQLRTMELIAAPAPDAGVTFDAPEGVAGVLVAEGVLSDLRDAREQREARAARAVGTLSDMRLRGDHDSATDAPLIDIDDDRIAAPADGLSALLKR